MIKNLELYKNNIDFALSKNNLSKLKNSSILVTGANGMIGSCIVDVLNELNEKMNYGIKIYAGVRNKQKALKRFLDYKSLNVVEVDVLKDISLDGKIDYVINCASNSDPKWYSQKPVETLLGNVIGTSKVMEYATKNNIKRVVYVSSGEAYGEDRREDADYFDEEYIGNIDSMKSRSCYPIGKKAAETLMVSYASENGIESIIVRPCHTYGPTMTDSDSRASSAFLRNAINGENIVMKSKGEQIRTYTYVVDSAIGILMALQNGENCNAYNISNKNAVASIYDFAKTVCDSSGLQVQFDIPGEIESRGYTKVKRSCLDGTKLEEIGWHPCFDVKQGIENSINIMK